ncbi:hypothetical protein BJX70DRAFT_395845 [Aspergillus crustosus]
MGYHIDGAVGSARPCALAYAAEGARGIVIADLDYNAALSTARESEALALNPAYSCLALAVDFTIAQSVEEMVQAAVWQFGRIDYSVNSAGIGIRHSNNANSSLLPQS